MEIAQKMKRRVRRVADSVESAGRRVADGVGTASDRMPSLPSAGAVAARVPSPLAVLRRTSTNDDDTGEDDGSEADDAGFDEVAIDDLVNAAEAARRRADELAGSDDGAAARSEATDLASQARDHAERAAEAARGRASEALEHARELAARALESSQQVERARRLDGDATAGSTPDATPTENSATDEMTEMNKDELYDIAQERDLAGRSSMTKDELLDALEDGD